MQDDQSPRVSKLSLSRNRERKRQRETWTPVGKNVCETLNDVEDSAEANETNEEPAPKKQMQSARQTFSNILQFVTARVFSPGREPLKSQHLEEVKSSQEDEPEVLEKDKKETVKQSSQVEDNDEFLCTQPDYSDADLNDEQDEDNITQTLSHGSQTKQSRVLNLQKPSFLKLPSPFGLLRKKTVVDNIQTEYDLVTPKRSGKSTMELPQSSLLTTPKPSFTETFKTPTPNNSHHDDFEMEDDDNHSEEDDNEILSSHPTTNDSTMQSQTPYLERVERNKRRNKDKLISLGFVPNNSHHPNQYQSPIEDVQEEYMVEDEVDDNGTSFTGMLFPTSYNGLIPTSDQLSSNISLEQKYPHREKQINLLRGLCSSSIRQVTLMQRIGGIEGMEEGSDLDAFVPAPIFVTGPSGSGKTCVVLDVLKELQTKPLDLGENIDTSKKVAVAYIDCATAEAHKTGISSVLESAYNQISSQLKPKFRLKNVKSKASKRRSFSDGSSAVCYTSSVGDSSLDNMSFSIGDSYDDGSLGDEMDDKHVSGLTKIEMTGFVDDDEEDWINNEAIKLINNQDDVLKPKQKKAQTNPRRSTRLGDNGPPERNKVNAATSTISTYKRPKKKSTTKLHAPMDFGREIVQFCGVTPYNSFQRGCAFLVLDHAEILLSFSPTSFHEKTNYLSQLLLLPRTLRLNLTVIVITDKCLLENTRINNVVRPNNTTGTIAEALIPFRIHFNAYKGVIEFRNVLTTPHLRQLVMADIEDEDSCSVTDRSILRQLHASMVEMIVQSVEGITRDTREFIRLSRISWPIFLDPLFKRQDVRDEFLSQLKEGNSTLKGTIVAKLGQHFQPYIKRLISDCLLQPGKTLTLSCNDSTSFSSSLPYLSKFLLLAAYLCQNNTPDKDQTLFTSQRVGRRKKSNANQNDNLSHASNPITQRTLKSERMNAFPLERMLSVFSSICNKYGYDIDSDSLKSIVGKERSLDIDTLGSISLFQNIAELKAMGLLEEVGSNSAFEGSKIYSRSVTSTKYICNVSRIQVDSIANELNFPLVEHLITFSTV